METPNEGGENFEAEIEAILNGGEANGAATPEATPEPKAQPTDAAGNPLKFGGRDWKDPSELGKAYEALLRDYSKKGNALKENEKWINWGKAIAKHQDLRGGVEKLINEFNSRGATTQAQREAVNPELAKRLEMMEAYVAKQEINSEISELKAKYKPDEETLKLVYAKAEEFFDRNVDIKLDDVYRMVAFDRQQLAAKTEGERLAAERLKKGKAANVGPSAASGVVPGAKPVESLSQDEYDQELANELKRFGITG